MIMIKRAIYIIISIFILASCNYIGSKIDTTPKRAIKIARYDRLQYEYVATNSVSALQQMNTEYPQATKLLIEEVLSIGKVDDDQINNRMKDYLSDSTLLTLMADAEMTFKDMTPIERELNRGFKKLKKELPGIVIPKVYAQFSALNQSIVVGDSLLGFSIDKYMGTDYPLYKRFYNEDQCRSMCKERIAFDCLVFYLQSQYPISVNHKSTLLDEMLYKGKIYWIVSNILEYDSFDEGFRFSKKESKWCRENKDRMLGEIILREKSYAGDISLATNFIKQDSLKIILGEDAPPSLYIWAGTELIDRYTQLDSEITIDQLIHASDYRRMLSDINIKF
jgi:hypothetical protein